MEKYKALIHLNSSDNKVYKSTIRQIVNLLKYFNEEIEIEVVCNGDAIFFCKKNSNPFEIDVKGLLLKNVKITICQNTLNSFNVSQSGLITGIGIVPSGIAELVMKQQQGFSYIKAGL